MQPVIFASMSGRSPLWLQGLSNTNSSTRAFLFYSLVLIAFGLYSAINRALLSSNISPNMTPVSLRDEPPAVVNLLINDLDNSADAPTSVLLHLARRDYYAIDISDDGIETVSKKLKRPETPLRDYETAVLQLVDLAVDQCGTTDSDTDTTTSNVTRALAIEELQAFCRAHNAASPEWWESFRKSVVDHALDLRLASRRCSPMTVGLLRILALVVVGIGVTTLGHSSEPRPSDPQSWAVGIFATSAVLSFLALSRLDLEELRYTRSGSEATADWLGTRSTMQHVGSFSELGPSTINIWGDRMFYATSTGIARETSRRLTLVEGDATEVWYVMNDRWHHTKAKVPRVNGWGRSPWNLLRDSAIPFLVSAAASSSVLAILWFGKMQSASGRKVGVSGAIDHGLHFPQRLSFSAVPQVVALAAFGGLLWVLRRHLRLATPVYHAFLDIFMSRREQGVVAYDKDGWIGIGNPHSRLMTLYRLPPDCTPERGNLVELTASRFFGQVRAVRAVQPPKPRKPAFS